MIGKWCTAKSSARPDVDELCRDSTWLQVGTVYHYPRLRCWIALPFPFVDPKGRALLIAAVEKQKFVYVMNRDSMNRLTISSPLGKWSLHNLLVVFAQA
jgi:hypothetical protein